MTKTTPKFPLTSPVDYLLFRLGRRSCRFVWRDSVGVQRRVSASILSQVAMLGHPGMAHRNQ